MMWCDVLGWRVRAPRAGQWAPVGVLAILFVMMSGACLGQSLLPGPLEDGLTPAPASEEEPAVPPDEPGAIDAAVTKLEERLAEAKRRIENAIASEGADAAIQFGVTPQETAERTRLLRNLVRGYEKHIDQLRRLKETRQTHRELKTEAEAWQGFPDPPPYSIDRADSLRDEVRGRSLEIHAIETSTPMTAYVLRQSEGDLAEAEKQWQAATENAESATDASTAGPLRWKRDMAALRLLLARTTIAQTKAEEAVLKEALAYHREYLDFVQRKLTVVAENTPFTQDELSAKIATISLAREAVQKELDAALQADASLQEALGKAREELRVAREAPAVEGEDPALRAQQIAEIQARVDARKAQADTSAFAVQALKIFVDTRNTEEDTWKRRFDVLHAKDTERLNQAHTYIEQRLDRMQQWKPYFDSNLELTLTQINTLQQRLENWRPEEGDKTLAEQTLRAYRDREKILRRGQARVNEIEQMLLRWEQEVEQLRQYVPWTERVRVLLGAGWALIEKVWEYALFTVAGKAVTVSKIFQAVAILVVGFIVSRWLAARIRRFTMERFNVEEGVAAPVEKVVHYLLVIAVVLFALSFVKIPLTIFAYLGGALAIGVGFGAQNLINNFISGLILLIERPVKVGDIVDLEGVGGRVMNIGARCSQVRGFDGVDMLVPNSAFLEQRVTNWTHTDRLKRLCVRVGVAYGSPTREVASLIAKAVQEHGQVMKRPEPVVVFEDFGDSALVFAVYFWVDILMVADARVVASDIRFHIDKLFREAGITMAFPQRDIHVDTARPIQVELVPPEKKGDA